MKTVKVVLNRTEVGRMLRAEGSYATVREMLTRRAEAVLGAAEATAPVASGAYKAGLGIHQDTTDRAAVRVVATADHSFIVESRTGNLARALDAAGGPG